MKNITEFTYNFSEYNNRVTMIDFINSLSEKAQAKISLYIHKLIEFKNNNIKIPERLSKQITDGIFELRVNFENRISRNLYFYEHNKEIIFTNGFIKKTRTTPKSEISKAIKIWNYYKEHKKWI